MALDTAELVEVIKHSRQHFLKHVRGLTPEQLDWKPYVECKNIRETLAHLVADDRAALQALQNNAEPDYDSLQTDERDYDRLLALLTESHGRLCDYLLTRYSDAPLDTEICVWGGKQKLGAGIPVFSSEDYYHAGQVTFIRAATDPTWNYYEAVYGGE